MQRMANPEDVVNMRNQIKEECGQTSDVKSIWVYFGSEMKSLTPECKFKTKDGGVWIDLNRSKIDDAKSLMEKFPPEAIESNASAIISREASFPVFQEMSSAATAATPEILIRTHVVSETAEGCS